jgi:hypothetical protein
VAIGSKHAVVKFIIAPFLNRLATVVQNSCAIFRVQLFLPKVRIL